MKREIKFRAWDKGTKDMFEGIDFHELIHWEEWELETTDGESSLPRNDVDWDDLIWMQFTGLLDKNGKEIYEGDILEFEYFGELFRDIVLFNNGMFCFLFENDYYPVEEYLHQKLAVIGNIYENPDLIKEEKK